MGVKRALILAVTLGVPASGALAQSAVQPAPPPAAQAAAEPVLLTLPTGARVRLHTMAAPGAWIKGILVSADSASVALVPENAPPLGANQLRVPSGSVGRFELHTGSKRHWLRGLLAGVALGVAIGFSMDVDPVACEFDYDYACSRGEAVAYGALGMGALGGGVGALIKTDRWTPVALDALGPPAPRVSGLGPRLRVLPRSGVELGLAVGF
jgi:hypothetical protein